MFGRRKELESSSIKIARKTGALILLEQLGSETKAGSLTGEQVHSVGIQILLDSERQTELPLSEITHLAGITNGNLPDKSFLPFLRLNYRTQKYDRPESTIPERILFDFRRLEKEDYITFSENEAGQLISITPKGIERARAEIIELRAKITRVEPRIPAN